MKLFLYVAIAAFCVAGVTLVADEKKDDKKDEVKGTKAPSSVHDFKVKSLEGKEVDLSKYKGSVLMVVNVASECGATPQYSQLQAVYERYSDKGFVVMGFPCNQFGAQEPGNATEIRQFCTNEYSVKFPMFEKIDVNGSGQAPLYKFLKETADDHRNIAWNFEKFIVGKNGKVVARFATGTTPDAPEVTQLIEEQLSE